VGGKKGNKLLGMMVPSTIVLARGAFLEEEEEHATPAGREKKIFGSEGLSFGGDL